MGRARCTPALVLACCLLGCTRGQDVLGTYSGSAFLTVDAMPAPGTSGTRGTPTVCAGTLRIDRNEDGRVRGRFTRAECVPSVFTGDVEGELTGTMMPDGTATLTFSPPPVASSQTIRTSCGCPDAPGAAGPYLGRIDKSSIALTTEFRLDCCGRPESPPQFVVQYQIAAAR